MPEHEPTRVEIAYGSTGLVVEFPADRTTVVAPVHEHPPADTSEILRGALVEPVAGPALRDVVRPGQRIAVSMCDVTRPQPRREMVQALLHELEGISTRADFVLLVATGTHRGNTDAELRAMLGDDVVDTMQIVNHDSRDAGSLVWVGTYGDAVPVWLNRVWVEADVRITTGFVEPHFFAGFSGGPKMVAPGLAGLETVLTLHDAARIGSERATWGICEGNPVHDDVRAIASGTGVDYAFDVVLNRDHEVIRAFGGELLEMHAAAREVVRELSMQPVPQLYDVVVTSNSGFPLDQNVYQAVKGMSAAATIVKPGGLIVCVAECRDGFPEHGSFRDVLASQETPEELLAAISAREETVPDQWQVQVLARVLTKARVGVYTTFLTDVELRTAHLFLVEDVARAVADELARVGPEARVCVLPRGPRRFPLSPADRHQEPLGEDEVVVVAERTSAMVRQPASAGERQRTCRPAAPCHQNSRARGHSAEGPVGGRRRLPVTVVTAGAITAEGRGCRSSESMPRPDVGPGSSGDDHDEALPARGLRPSGQSWSGGSMSVGWWTRNVD